MLWVIEKLTRRPVLCGLSFFIVLTAYLSGGMTALRLDSALCGRVARFVFCGEDYWTMVGAVVRRRAVLAAAQGFFGIWMASAPLSVASGMLLQMSISLPWWCMAENALQGVFLAMLMLLPSMVSLFAGGVAMTIWMQHFLRMLGERHMRKSAAQRCCEGLFRLRGMLLAAAVPLLLAPLEVFFFMNIA